MGPDSEANHGKLPCHQGWLFQEFCLHEPFHSRVLELTRAALMFFRVASNHRRQEMPHTHHWRLLFQGCVRSCHPGFRGAEWICSGDSDSCNILLSRRLRRHLPRLALCSHKFGRIRFQWHVSIMVIGCGWFIMADTNGVAPGISSVLFVSIFNYAKFLQDSFCYRCPLVVL